MRQPKRSMRPLLVLTAAVLTLAGCGDEDEGGNSGLRSTQTAQLQYTPDSFAFPKLAPGQTMLREVELRNLGTAELAIRNVRLVDRSTAGEFELFAKGDGDALEPVPDLIVIAGGGDEVVVLAVRYTPADESVTPDAGTVRFQTNDKDAFDVEIPVLSGESGAEIVVSPSTLDFGVVEAGGTAARDVNITNIGQVDLVISNVAVEGSPDFGARLGERDLLGDLADDPVVVGRGASITIQATYAPPSLGPDTGELRITSNDPNQPVAVINLRANGAVPCLQVVPDSIEFAAGLIVDDPEGETPNRRTVTIENCGTTALQVDAIEIEGGDDAFRLTEPFEPFELPAPDPDDPALPSRPVEIGFWPTEPDTYGARMHVHSNADPVPVDLFGRGVVNACPIPVVAESALQVHPLDIVTLDGSPSSDPGGEVQAWRWTVVARPDGSVSVPVESFADPRRPADGGPPDDEGTPQARFFVDLAGHYEIELQVIDNLGQVSCDPPAARVVIDAVPEKDLHVQLVWSTPADPDETDEHGTDVDLHLRHERAGQAWGEPAAPWDCYFDNTNPDWGVPGDVVDNPSLDIDDTNGAGPENINLAKPEVGVTYDIGAIYFRSTSIFGDPDRDPLVEHPSLATVRIYVRGELLAEWIDRELTTLRQLWWVASVVWCEDFSQCPEVIPRDEVLEEAEYARP